MLPGPVRLSSFIKMSCASYLRSARPKAMSRAKQWTDEVENLYRFQQAGYRDELEYKQIKQVEMIDRWPETGFVKKLQRRDNTFYYYNRKRECEDKEVHKVKVYAY
ncbi:meiosis expressed gene 1 protein homolog isoform X1 [Conger conger]|uniref:meiosis expressed gene 1 protein homolog isoform X1 n=2 Tax=Conger conger TaxID=82655 RepID=UPI002A59DD9F|nr:meiosis expressed gene 1 protein homolog isoform X1 [Conger conger]